MSRGLGAEQRAVQRIVLDDDCDRWWSLGELAAAALPGPVTRAAVESVRRASLSLARADLLHVEVFDELVDVTGTEVERGAGTHRRDKHYATRQKMFVHRPLSVEAKRRRIAFRAARPDTDGPLVVS